jgi:hypothetical protein
MSNLLIYVIPALVLAAVVAGWFYSARTRRLARFALILIAAGAALFGLYLLVILLWFPVAL